MTAHQYRKMVEDESVREFIQARSKEAGEKLPSLLEELEIDFGKILGFDLSG